MIKIGLFSQIGKTTIKTLRHYDDVGLLSPAHIDGQSGYRYYTTDQLVTLHKIVSLRQIGFGIEEVKQILHGVQADGIIAARKAQLESTLLDVQDKLSRIKHYKMEDIMNYQAVIKETPECIIYSKKLTVPNYDAYFEVIPAIGEEVKESNPNLVCAVPEYCFISYLDGEYREKDINIEYCEAVNAFGTETETIKFRKIPSIQVVSVLHKGPYAGLRNAYAFAFKWIEENGYTVTDFCRESYIDGIWNKDSEEDWLTELQIPIAKK